MPSWRTASLTVSFSRALALILFSPDLMILTLNSHVRSGSSPGSNTQQHPASDRKRWHLPSWPGPPPRFLSD